MTPLTLLRGHPNRDVSELSDAVAAGDSEAVYGLLDVIEEEGIEMYQKDLLDVLEVGKCAVLMTDTFYWIGVVERIGLSGVILKDTAWVADFGHFENSLKNGEKSVNEADPVPGDGRWFVANAHIRSAGLWPHPPIRKRRGGSN